VESSNARTDLQANEASVTLYEEFSVATFKMFMDYDVRKFKSQHRSSKNK